jgi:hypothetical protein
VAITFQGGNDMRSIDPIERFWQTVNKTEGCWLYTGMCSRGYGRFWLNKDRVAAHRFSYELAYGPIPEGLSVCHKCDVRNCVRPDHLFLGTYKDNLQDASRKGRMQHGATHYLAKLTDEKVRTIRQDFAQGTSSTKLSRRFGVAKQTIRAIVRGKTWRHVK